MMMRRRHPTAVGRGIAFAFALLAVPGLAGAQGVTAVSSLATRDAHLDGEGVVRWSDDGSEVSLFGANYVIHTASDYRAAGYVGGDRKAMIDEDMAHFARMGWDALRLTFWGDWEASDTLGNLIENDHLDLLDYLIARARERGIYMLFSPIQLYGSNWPDALGDTTAPGFGRRYSKEVMGTDPAAIAAQANYLRQILEHVNPYTGVVLKDEPAILFVELVNEPWHHPEDLEGSVRYIDTLVDAVRSTGCDKLVFYNVSQDFRIGEAIRRSKAEGVAFGWYPTGLNSGRELEGNHLRTVDVFPDMLRPELAGMPRIVYEFDSADLRTATMYPAMTRTMRSVGTQFAVMFSYDMLRTASRNLGWQTHYLNLVYTPRKAMSAVIAAEAMRRLPRMRTYGEYPANTRFGEFRVDYASDLAELVATDVFMHAGTTSTPAPDPASLRRLAGYGSSPIVAYEGEGAWFLDRVRPGVWRLEVYPDAVPVEDPFEMPSPRKIVTRALHRAWPMRVVLPDLGAGFTVQGVGDVAGRTLTADEGRFTVTPGVWVLSADGSVAATTLPPRIGAIGFAEFHAPPSDPGRLRVEDLSAGQHVAGRDGAFRFRIVDAVPPDSARLAIRAAGGGYRTFELLRGGAYRWAATVPAGALAPGLYDYVVTTIRDGVATTFPDAVPGRPTDWDYHARGAWAATVVEPGTPLRLFDPAADFPRLAFTRIGDAGRRGLFRMVPTTETGGAAFRLELPVDADGSGPPDYTASLVIRDRMAARGETVRDARTLTVRARALGPGQIVHVTLVEEDGTSWTAPVALGTGWSEHTLRISDLSAGRGVLLPQGFPGQWSYWVGSAVGRGGADDAPRIERVERLQLSLRRADDPAPAPGRYGVEVESVVLTFASPAGLGSHLLGGPTYAHNAGVGGPSILPGRSALVHRSTGRPGRATTTPRTPAPRAVISSGLDRLRPVVVRAMPATNVPVTGSGAAFAPGP